MTKIYTVAVDYSDSVTPQETAWGISFASLPSAIDAVMQAMVQARISLDVSLADTPKIVAADGGCWVLDDYEENTRVWYIQETELEPGPGKTLTAYIQERDPEADKKRYR